MIKKEKDVQGGKFIRDIDRRLGVDDIDRKKNWKQNIEKVVNEENV